MEKMHVIGIAAAVVLTYVTAYLLFTNTQPSLLAVDRVLVEYPATDDDDFSGGFSGNFADDFADEFAGEHDQSIDSLRDSYGRSAETQAATRFDDEDVALSGSYGAQMVSFAQNSQHGHEALLYSGYDNQYDTHDYANDYYDQAPPDIFVDDQYSDDQYSTDQFVADQYENFENHASETYANY